MDALKRRYNTLVTAIAELEEKIRQMQDLIDFLTETNANLEQALDINKEIMRNSITDNNLRNQHMAEEIRILKEKLRASDGDND
jgi:predicted  nucleic acid-binding Zn-ribbon protein